MARTRPVENSLFAHSGSWVEALADQYFYRSDQLDVGVDAVAVYRDAAHRQPLLLIRGADVGLSGGAIQHARAHGFQFLVTGSPDDFKTVKLGVFENDEQPVAAFPAWMPGHPRDRLVSKTTVLLPFGSEHDLRAAFGECHDLAYKSLANDPAATFDLILLVVAAKVLDERGPETSYRFGLLADDRPTDSSDRLASLIAEAARWLDGSAASLGDVPRVPVALASRLLAVFQNFSLTLTAEAVGGTDILGTAYETIVGATFRGELGSYFTPRTMADFIGRVLDVQKGRVLDPACGSAGLLLAIRRMSGSLGEVEYFGNDLNPRMVRAAKVNFLLHGLDPTNVLQGDGLQLDRIIRDTVGLEVGEQGPWWSALPDGPFDAVVANPPFAGFEGDESKLRRIETAYKSDGSLRSLNRTLPFIESIVGSLRLGGVAGLVLPTSILNAEEESFVRLRQLLLTKVELMAIIGLPEKAFVHTDCGVHGALLFVRRVAKPRVDYDVFVDWAVHLGYDRLGRYRRENDFPEILDRYRSERWPERNRFPIQTLIEHGRMDPAWLHVVRSLPSAGNKEDFVHLTDLLTVRDARFSKREIHDDGTYHFFEVADTELETGRVLRIHETSGFELRKKGRIRNRVQAGDVLLPNHRDSLIAKGAPTGRSAGLVNEEADGALTTDRFLVLTPRIDPALLQVVLNSAGVRRQIVAQCRGAASLDIREKTLASVLVPRVLVDSDTAEEIKSAAADLLDLRLELEDKTRKLRSLVDATFGESDADFRPTGWSHL
jgi:type I restriction enzyme M protein